MICDTMTRQEIEEKMDELARGVLRHPRPGDPEEIYELAKRLGESIEGANQKVNAKLTSSCLLTPPTSDSAFASASRRILDISHLSADAQDFSLPRTPLLASESNSCKSASSC
jgi:hypothetical protein